MRRKISIAFRLAPWQIGETTTQKKGTKMSMNTEAIIIGAVTINTDSRLGVVLGGTYVYPVVITEHPETGEKLKFWLKGAPGWGLSWGVVRYKPSIDGEIKPEYSGSYRKPYQGIDEEIQLTVGSVLSFGWERSGLSLAATIAANRAMANDPEIDNMPEIDSGPLEPSGSWEPVAYARCRL